jgi:hypothetical protein
MPKLLSTLIISIVLLIILSNWCNKNENNMEDYTTLNMAYSGNSVGQYTGFMTSPHYSLMQYSSYPYGYPSGYLYDSYRSPYNPYQIPHEVPYEVPTPSKTANDLKDNVNVKSTPYIYPGLSSMSYREPIFPTYDPYYSRFQYLLNQNNYRYYKDKIGDLETKIETLEST